MYQVQTLIIEPQSVIRISFTKAGTPLLVSDFIYDLQQESAFRSLLTNTLKACPFPAFFFELPAITKDRLQQIFECVLVNSKSLLTINANPTPFAAHFSTEASVVSFPNLGGDAHLIVPTPFPDTNYAHLAVFLRSAAAAQIDSFWKKAGVVYQKAIGSSPKWLSTAGLGVSWLHLRVDSRPKYYRYEAYKQY